MKKELNNQLFHKFFPINIHIAKVRPKTNHKPPTPITIHFRNGCLILFTFSSTFGSSLVIMQIITRREALRKTYVKKYLKIVLPPSVNINPLLKQSLLVTFILYNKIKEKKPESILGWRCYYVC